VKIKRQDARVGHLVSEDIMGMTSVPLIMKGTVLTDQHIKALRAFNIQELTVESAGDLLKATPPAQQGERDERKVESTPFLTRYMKSVEDYKKEFVKWQSGMAVDIAKIREILLSVLAEVQESPTLIHTVIQVQSKPDYLYHHAMATALLSMLIGKKLGIDDTQSTQLGLGAALSNCGMAKISSIILKKERPLTEREFSEVKMHPVHSYKLIKDSPLLKSETKLAILQHHERYDGTGYPSREKGDRVHLYAQIIGIADIFHAMSSDRLYKTKQPIFKVLDIIRKDHFGQFPPQVVTGLLGLISGLSTGTGVRLTSGHQGKVVFTQSHSPTRPIIKLEGSEELLDLSKQQDVHIAEVLS